MIKHKILALVRSGFQAVGRTSIFDIITFPFKWLTFRRISAIVSGLIVGSVWFGFFILSPVRPIVRDAVLTVIADKLAGPNIPVTVCEPLTAGPDCDLVYTGGSDASRSLTPAGDAESEWGLVTNSTFLTNMTHMISPFFTYELLTDKVKDPVAVIFIPRAGDDSLNNLGQVIYGIVVLLNERMLYFEPWNDAKTIQATLTHELIHIQGGNFLYSPEPLPASCYVVMDDGQSKYFCAVESDIPKLFEWASRRSVWVEQHTQAATVEVLAAMCNSGDRLACSSFWDDFGRATSGSLEVELKSVGLQALYQPFMNVMTRNSVERSRAEKALRYWVRYPGGRDAIVLKYGQGPWVNYILPYIVHGRLLDTGNTYQVDEGYGYKAVIGMPFDDIEVRLGPVLTTFIRLTSQ